jgi:hypothetical protein
MGWPAALAAELASWPVAGFAEGSINSTSKVMGTM